MEPPQINLKVANVYTDKFYAANARLLFDLELVVHNHASL